MYTKICELCNRQFTTVKKTARFCTMGHSREYAHKHRIGFYASWNGTRRPMKKVDDSKPKGGDLK